MKFKSYSFKELLSNIVDNRGKTCPVGDAGVPLIATNCIKEHSLYPVFEKVRYVSDETYTNWFRGHPQPGDMIFVCKGSPGRVNWVPDPVNFCIAQDMVAIRADTTKVYPKYLFALLRSQASQQKILNMHVGSLIPHFKKGDFGNLYFELPEDLEYQKKVGDAYFDFCLKIESNNQLNQTLEEMAQAIFKSWFVDFEPVKAKMNGEQPEGMDAATASLFPEKLVESELGLIPDGWEPKQLKDIVELAYGKALKKTDRVAGDVPVYGSGGLTGYHNQSLVEGPGIIVGRKGTVGSVYWEPKAFYPIDTVFYVKPKAGYSLKYCHLVLQNLGLKYMNTDAAVPGLNRNNAYRLDVITPSESVLKKFEEMMQSFQSKVDANNAQNACLESLRDTLLPKLLSGEIELGRQGHWHE
ncbi:restriction endonuclease subunit S [Vibrio parahaemolyticus]|uniref:restriction endonuclease subunit S n=1 Tax=Vibrio parahaemolyticus TaxID=670 RepID=UPI001121F3DA|nr:restriction endonuclease subunit S [Vibrio parahaemolyticus]TOH16452.1 type I restriction endonuclease [Vibrio parahaemolyticus]